MSGRFEYAGLISHVQRIAVGKSDTSTTAEAGQTFEEELIDLLAVLFWNQHDVSCLKRVTSRVTRLPGDFSSLQQASDSNNALITVFMCRVNIHEMIADMLK